MCASTVQQWLSKHQKYYFLASSFCCLICKTYLMVKIRQKIGVKSVKTPLHRHKKCLAPSYGLLLQDSNLQRSWKLIWCEKPAGAGERKGRHEGRQLPSPMTMWLDVKPDLHEFGRRLMLPLLGRKRDICWYLCCGIIFSYHVLKAFFATSRVCKFVSES